jgi:adenine-specific DNA-methyltransferase
VWQDSRYDANEYGTKLLKDLVPNSDFLFPKSLWNTHDCVYAVVGNNKNAIILDFFAGSGTTAHAVLEMNKNDGGTRQFIMCEQMYYVDTVTKERLRQVVKRNKQGNFVYAELAKANEEFIDKIQSYNSKKDLINVWNEMQEKAFLCFRLSDKMEKIRFEEIENSDIALIKTFLLEVLDKNFLYVPFSEIDDKSYGFEKDEITINKNFMTLDDND